MKVVGVLSSDIIDEWESIAPFFANFATRSDGRWTVDDLVRAVGEKKKQIWKVGDWQAVCLTSVDTECVNIEACAGVRRHEWQDDLEAEIIKWARALGKRRVFAIVRPGWAKFMKAKGYKEKHREMMLEI